LAGFASLRSENCASTTITRTAPRSGARSSAALRIVSGAVPSGYAVGGRIVPSSRPSQRGWRLIETWALSGVAPADRNSLNSVFMRALSSGLGAIAQKSFHAALMLCLPP
jgi:hypothetical protein